MPQSRIARRDFLRGAIALSAASLLPAAAFGRTRRGSNQLTLAYWDGTHFVSATQIQADSTLETVRLSFSGFGKGSIRIIQGVSNVNGSSKSYYAYVTPPAGAPKTRFSRSVDLGGLLFNVSQGTNDALSVQKFKLTDSNGSDARLREGVYVLFDGTVTLGSLVYDKNQKSSPVVRANGIGSVPQYVVLTVGRG